MKFETRGDVTKILPALAFSAALISNSHADCRAPIPENGNPKEFSKSVTVKLNPSRFEAILHSKIHEILPSKMEESWIIESWVESRWRMQDGDSWKCNFSTFRWPKDEIRFLTAKHCVSNEFRWINSDVWVSEGFNASSVQTRIVKKTGTILEQTHFPSNGETIALSGCLPSNGECFRIEGKMEDVFKKDGETVRGIWISRDDYSRMTQKWPSASLEGLSGAPTLDAEGRVFGTVSATVAADFQKDSMERCLPSSYAITVAPMKRID